MTKINNKATGVCAIVFSFINFALAFIGSIFTFLSSFYYETYLICYRDSIYNRYTYTYEYEYYPIAYCSDNVIISGIFMCFSIVTLLLAAIFGCVALKKKEFYLPAMWLSVITSVLIAISMAGFDVCSLAFSICIVILSFLCFILFFACHQSSPKSAPKKLPSDNGLPDALAKIDRFKTAYDAGAISENEFAELKRKILNNLQY